MLKKIDKRIILVMIMMIQIVFMLYYCNMKSGFFVDEIWSYGLANSYYHAQVWEDGALDNAQIDPEQFKDYVVVKKGEEFKYDSVFYNQTHDVHPPFYYCVLHTISSLFPNEFSKWFGLIPNIFFYVITMIFLYKISGFFTNNRYFAFAPVILYGFSIAAVNSVTYIRMYMMLAMWAMMFAYFHLKVIAKKMIRWYDLLLLALSVIGGALTQYFFVIFAFPWVIFMLIYLGVNRNVRGIVKYIFTGAISGGIAILIFPTFLWSILGLEEGRSESMFANLHNFTNWASNLNAYIDLTSSEMFGGCLRLIMLLCVLSGVLYVVFKVFVKVSIVSKEDRVTLEFNYYKGRQHCLEIGKTQTILVAILTFSILFYYILVAKIAPYNTDRFVMCIMPLLPVLFCLIIYGTYFIWIKNNKKRLIALYVSIILTLGLTYFSNDPQFIYESKKDNVSISEKYSDDSCVYLFSMENMRYILVNNALELGNYNKLYQMIYSDIDDVIPKVDVTNSELVVYIDKILFDKSGERTKDDLSLTGRECIERIQSLTALDKEQKLFEDDKVMVYLLSK